LIDRQVFTAKWAARATDGRGRFAEANNALMDGKFNGNIFDP
jgi:hypothetical protein